MMPLWTTTTRPCSPGAGARSPRWAGRGWPSACGRCRRRRGSGSACRLSSRLLSLPTERRRSQRAVRDHRDPGGVVAAVLQPPQALDDDGHRVPRSDVADDAAHGRLSASGRRCRASPPWPRPRSAAGPHSAPSCACTSLAARARARLGPARLHHLPGPAEGQRTRGHVLGDGAARADVGALARSSTGATSVRVAADEGAGLDRASGACRRRRSCR